MVCLWRASCSKSLNHQNIADRLQALRSRSAFTCKKDSMEDKISFIFFKRNSMVVFQALRRLDFLAGRIQTLELHLQCKLKSSFNMYYNILIILIDQCAFKGDLELLMEYLSLCSVLTWKLWKISFIRKT